MVLEMGRSLPQAARGVREEEARKCLAGSRLPRKRGEELRPAVLEMLARWWARGWGVGVMGKLCLLLPSPQLVVDGMRKLGEREGQGEREGEVGLMGRGYRWLV